MQDVWRVCGRLRICLPFLSNPQVFPAQILNNKSFQMYQLRRFPQIPQAYSYDDYLLYS